MKKLSRGAYEDTKGILRVAETLLEVLILTVIYYLVWKNGLIFSLSFCTSFLYIKPNCSRIKDIFYKYYHIFC